MVKINGDLIPISSGQVSLGINQSAGEVFDLSTIAPFNRYFTLSGVYMDPVQGQSGVIRYSRQQAALQVSVDGGLTFNNIATTASVVTSVGQLGGADLTGAVDFASKASGFIAITDSAGASPILWAVDNLGLSGLWRFPSNGFPSTIVRSFAATFTSATTWTVTHNIGTVNCVVNCYDAGSPRAILIPDDIKTTDTNTVTVTFNSAQAGLAVVMGAV